MGIITELNAIIDQYHLLKHPYYQAWSKGELSLDSLQKYAAQYYQQVSSFPRFISRVHTHCDDLNARKILLANLIDEELHGTDHPTLWMQFANGLGVKKSMVLNDTILPQTTEMVETYYQLANQDWRDGLCALYAYEFQVPEISTSKIEGLKKFYGISDEETLEFFTAHQQYDVGHAAQVGNLIELHASSKTAAIATEKACKALWGFLDGMCETSGIHCSTH